MEPEGEAVGAAGFSSGEGPPEDAWDGDFSLVLYWFLFVIDLVLISCVRVSGTWRCCMIALIYVVCTGDT